MVASGNVKHVVLDKVRSTLNLIRKSNVGYFQDEQGNNNLVSKLKQLQNSLQSDDDQQDPYDFVSPFVAILHSPYLAGPFKLAALDAIESFLILDILVNRPTKNSDILRDVVNAVARCKFVQTDIVGDELVQLSIIHVLLCFVKCNSRHYLAETTVMDIAESCRSMMFHIAGDKKMHIYQAAERTVLELVRFVFSEENAASHGLQTIQRLAFFFVEILDKHSSVAFGVRSAKSTGISTSSSRPSLAFSDSSLDTGASEIIFVLKAFHAMLLPNGDVDASRRLLLRSPELSSIFRNDLGRRLVMLCSRRDLPPVVLQMILSVFSSMLLMLGPSLRIAVECFVKYVFLRALVQLRSDFANFDEAMRLNSEAQAVGGSPVNASPPSGSQVGSESGFSIDELEIILQCLSDMLSDASFLPMLFINFDCDPTKPDIVQPLVMHLSTCARYTIVCEPDELGPLREVGSLSMKCFRLLMSSFASREAAKRKHSSIVAAATAAAAAAAEKSRESINYSDDNPDRAGAAISDSTQPIIDSAFIDSFSREVRNARLSKLILSEAASRFCRKPKEGLQYLQDEGILPTPLSPASVATFLRVAPGLPKENTGAFLGELGKDNPSFEADSKVFHREVLECYVRSFELRGQTVLNCMRIFLSAFRLPGEAQQIDRILVSFSEYCHENCVEGASGLLENPEVTYLLTFSIIMLNTDLHNPNVRPDRKMTIDQFVKNNTFYGAELKQTKPIPRDYLEEIYKAISECQIRTERNDLSASMTPEMWMDLQLQAALNAEKGLLFTSSYSSGVILNVLACRSLGNISDVVDEAVCGDNLESGKVLSSAGKWTTSALVKSAELFNIHWVADFDLFDIVWENLLVVPLSAFLMHRCTVAPSIPTLHLKRKAATFEASSGPPSTSVSGAGKSWRRKPPSARAVQEAVEILLEFLDMVKIFDVASVADSVVVLLAGFAGVMKEKLYGTILRTFSPLDFQVHHFSEVLAKSSSASRHSVVASSEEESSWVPNSGDILLETLLGSLGARAALRLVLHLAHQEPRLFGTESRCWKIVWLALSSLRDCALLPSRMVVDADVDLLPPQCRAEFEARLKTAQQLRGVLSTKVDDSKTVPTKKSASMLSLLNIGEVFFGPSATRADDKRSDASTFSSCHRWDDGYEGEETISARPANLSPRGKFSLETPHRATTESSSQQNSLLEEGGVGDAPLLINRYRQAASGIVLASEITLDGLKDDDDESRYIILAFAKMRQMVDESGIADIVVDTRFFGENSLLDFICAITSTIQSAEGAHKLEDTSGGRALTPCAPHVHMTHNETKNFRLGATCDTILQEFDAISASSTSWLEMVLVEAVLRNRDRFALLWPHLSDHYRKTLVVASEFNYALERRVTGIFKIATRMLSREQLTDPILEILGQVFTYPKRCKPVEARSLDDSGDSSEINQKLSYDSLSTVLLAEVAGQVSAGVWRLITQNVSVLPRLRLEQWQILFDLIAVGAAAGGYSSIKAFEAMAWLLHEPRLRAEVPVFCVVGLRPLLCNPHAPVLVSVGAVELLSHLHTRLEVLVTDEKVDFTEPSGSLDDTPILWESCWTPILQALADGVSDDRVAVRAAAAETIAKAIVEKHVLRGVPPGVMVNTLGDIVVPTVILLGESLLEGAKLSETCAETRSGRPDLKVDGDNNTDAYVGDVLSYDENVLRNSEPLSAGSHQTNTFSKEQLSDGNDRTKKTAFARALLSSMTIHDGNVVPVASCLSALCETFIMQIDKLAGYPSFDKLWLRLIHVLGFFLGAPHGFDHELLRGADSSTGPSMVYSRELTKAVGVSKEKIFHMVKALLDYGVFKHRRGLWSVTGDTIQQFKACPDIIGHIMDYSVLKLQ